MVEFKELVNGKVDKVIEKMVFADVKEEMVSIQSQIWAVAKKNAELTGGDVSKMQKILVDSFLNTNEPIVTQKEDGELNYFSDLEMFMGSIPSEKKVELFEQVFNLFLDEKKEERKESVSVEDNGSR
ncbi:hypothetical protein [Exiguobacterium sp. BG5(2022)]|jgi:hypothetical protein|uniref:hypothetical protein n=1 Tax=Exiguobacterium sp. BG5(2022) TaxID=2962595 RepID=UPI0028815416|nr:hypothetical protein [Exiguobacterium sp. BG5(2022)]MDT0193702.1 hypothetical protein [Exiguobacterium sp. BG5(2022)]